MPSSRFEELEKRIFELRNCFLPVDFDPTGLYEDFVYEHTRAFRVLAHAEFESFIEDRVLEVIDEAVAKWRASGEVSVSLLAAVAYRESAPAIPGSLSEATSKRRKYPTLSARVEEARSDLHRFVRNQNHGIKEKNLLRMLLPIGLLEEELDTAWISDIDAWATARGDAAHKGAKMQVRPDPQKEMKAVGRILSGFRDLDGQMEGK
ncbi:HEPN domain-containing protein [Streptomyces sp. NPDC017529]|uniref:HEPN domain-containing protein n=1 Tax=Streptomyces sp. NPDC017529 TaxID=3365000 RepID=UPI0037A1E4DA